MIVRMLVAAAAMAATFGPVGSFAQDAPGMIVCEKDVDSVQTYLESNRQQLSAEAIRDAEQRLDIARTQCNASPQSGSNTVAQLRRELGMEASTQTAEPPQEGQAPAGQ